MERQFISADKETLNVLFCILHNSEKKGTLPFDKTHKEELINIKTGLIVYYTQSLPYEDIKIIIEELKILLPKLYPNKSFYTEEQASYDACLMCVGTLLFTANLQNEVNIRVRKDYLEQLITPDKVSQKNNPQTIAVKGLFS